MEERLNAAIDRLDSAIADFERALSIDLEALDETVADAVRSGQTQKFEFTVELFWKTAKLLLLERHGFDQGSPKGAIKKYFEAGYIEYAQCDRLLRSLDMRNSLSHIYSKDGFLALFQEIIQYGGFFPKAASGMREPPNRP